MAKTQSVKQVIRAAGPVISKQEMNQIVKAAGGNTETAINRIASVQSNMKEAGKTAPAVASGAANMLIKQAQATPSIVGTTPFGTSKLGQTLQSMVGSPGYTAPRNPQSGAPYGGSTSAIPTQLVPGGMMIRPGGNLAVRPQTTAAVSDSSGFSPYGGMAIGQFDSTGAGPLASPNTSTWSGNQTTGGEGTTTGGDAFDYQSILDAIAGIQQPEFDMSALTDMFNTQFQQLSSQFDQMNPIQLAQLGKAYGGDAIRARQRMRKTSRDYRRNLPAMALGQSLANLAGMGIGGGVTL